MPGEEVVGRAPAVNAVYRIGSRRLLVGWTVMTAVTLMGWWFVPGDVVRLQHSKARRVFSERRHAPVASWLPAEALGAAIGGTVGLSQWVVLRRVMPRAWWWIVMTGIGGALGVVSFRETYRVISQVCGTVGLPVLLEDLLHVGALVAPVAVLQWWALHEAVRCSWVWVPWSTMSIATGVAICSAVPGNLSPVGLIAGSVACAVASALPMTWWFGDG